jgi:hypothetical protein
VGNWGSVVDRNNHYLSLVRPIIEPMQAESRCCHLRKISSTCVHIICISPSQDGVKNSAVSTPPGCTLWRQQCKSAQQEINSTIIIYGAGAARQISGHQAEEGARRNKLSAFICSTFPTCMQRTLYWSHNKLVLLVCIARSAKTPF